MTKLKFHQRTNKSSHSAQYHIWRKVYIFLLIFAWIFSGWPHVWKNTAIPPLIPQSLAASAYPSRIIQSDLNGVAVAPTNRNYFASPFTGDLILGLDDHANKVVTFRTAGTISYLSANIKSGNRTASDPRVAFYKNGSEANGANDPKLTLAPGGSPVGAGELVDSTHTLSVSAGDTIALYVASGGSGNSNWTFTYIGFVFTPSTGTVSRLGASGSLAYTVASETAYRHLGGTSTKTTTQAIGETLIKIPTGTVTIRNIQVFVSANTRTTDTTFTISGATGSGTAPSVTYSSGQTGLKEDTSNTKVVNDGDKLSFQSTTLTDTGTLTVQNIMVELYDSSGGIFFLALGNTGGAVFAVDNQPQYLGGRMVSLNVAESLAQFSLGFAASFSRLSAYQGAESSGGTFILRQDSTDTTVQAATNATGWFSDTSNTYSTDGTDLVATTWDKVANTTYYALSIAVQVANPAPTLSISQPDGTGDTVTVGDSYNITYTLADTDDVVTAAFYYDTNNSGLDGVAISGACASAAEGTNSTCSWDTTGVTPGDYYVYGITSDGFNPQVSAYSSGVITIQSAGGTLSADIVDSNGDPVTSPTLTMTTKIFNLIYQTTTGTFGISSEKIRVDNSTGNAQWTLTVAANAGPTALWSSGTPKYDFNDPTAQAGDGGDADSYGGQMSIDPTGATITPKSGCNNTGLSLGSQGSFSQGVTDSITLLTAGASAGTNCYWDLTGTSISQTIPAEQTAGSYTIEMTITVTAN